MVAPQPRINSVGVTMARRWVSLGKGFAVEYATHAKNLETESAALKSGPVRSMLSKEKRAPEACF